MEISGNELKVNGVDYVRKDLIAVKEVNTLPITEGTPYRVGAAYLVRTVTMIYTGRLVRVYDKELVLTEAAWIADTGRWADTIKSGNFKEVEPYPTNTEINVNRDSILDSFVVTFELPKTQK